jgi:hypothetical protein
MTIEEQVKEQALIILEMLRIVEKLARGDFMDGIERKSFKSLRERIVSASGNEASIKDDPEQSLPAKNIIKKPAFRAGFFITWSLSACRPLTAYFQVFSGMP